MSNRSLDSFWLLSESFLLRLLLWLSQQKIGIAAPWSSLSPQFQKEWVSAKWRIYHSGWKQRLGFSQKIVRQRPLKDHLFVQDVWKVLWPLPSHSLMSFTEPKSLLQDLKANKVTLNLWASKPYIKRLSLSIKHLMI